MGIYEELGIRRVINGNATLTRLGGSVLAPGVLEAMAEASAAFVDIMDLERTVGAEIARLTRNEDCCVPSGAAAGLTLVTAACVAGTDPELRARLPFTAGMKDEVVVHGHTRVGYDFAIRMAGVRLVEIGGPGGTAPVELERALSPRTAAMFYFPRGTEERGELPLEAAVQICGARAVPVIVDAAAQLPPKSSLWSFTARGASAAIFSGGKGLRGPQATGLVLGRRWLTDACRFHASPLPFIGRGMKVGKEELCGLLAAVRWYLAEDEEAELARYEAAVAETVRAFAGHPAVSARRAWPSEAGQPMPRAELRLDEARLGISRDAALAALRGGCPAVDLAPGDGSVILLNPQTLQEGELETVLRRLREVLR